METRLEDAFARQRGFVSEASHELRSPLTAIGGQIEVLAREREPDAAPFPREAIAAAPGEAEIGELAESKAHGGVIRAGESPLGGAPVSFELPGFRPAQSERGLTEGLGSTHRKAAAWGACSTLMRSGSARPSPASPTAPAASPATPG